MSNKIIKYGKMALTGELFYRIRKKVSVCFVKNKIIRNNIFEDNEYRRLKRKYYHVIQNRPSANLMRESNKVWVFWYQGIDEAPLLVKKCIFSIKKTFSDKEVIILTKENYEKYITLPDYIMDKFIKKDITFTHFSDILRIALLAQYGGIWCDATLLFTDKVPKYVEDADLFVFKNINLDQKDKNAIVASSWFIVCKSNHDIITATRDLLFEYHKKEKYLRNYFLIHLLFTMATEKYREKWESVPTFSNINPHILQFELLKPFNKKRFEQIKAMSFVHKLNKAIMNEDSEKNTFYDFIINKLERKD